MDDFIKQIESLSPEKRELLELFLKEGPSGAALQKEEYVAPRDPLEEKLCAIWAKALGVERVGVNDNFFDLGGDSINSIQIIAQANQVGIRLTTSQLFEHPTVGALAEVVNRSRADEVAQSRVTEDLLNEGLSSGVEAQSLSRFPESEDIYTLSPTQQGMLFEILSASRPGLYFDQTLCVLHGELDLPAFGRAWQKAVDRHAALRTAVVWEGLSEPVQAVRKEARLQIEVQDWRDLSESDQHTRLADYLEADRARGFELSEPPLMRLAVIRLDSEKHQVVWSNHHLVLDAWCVGILLREIFAFYEALSQDEDDMRLPPAPAFREYISWLKRQDLTAMERYWREALRGFKPPDSPFSIGRPALRSGVNAEHRQKRFTLSVSLTPALEAFARRRRLTLNTIAQGAWALMQSHYSDAREVMFGAVFSGRPPEVAGIEAMIGSFINTLPVRTRVSADEPLSQWLAGIQDNQSKMQRYAFAPLRNVLNWSESPKGVPLFETIFVFMNAAADVSRLDTKRLKISDARSIGFSNYPLTIRLTPGSQWLLEALYDASRFDDAEIDRLAERFESLLAAMTADDSKRVGDLIEGFLEKQKPDQAPDAKARRQAMADRMKKIKPKALSSAGVVKSYRLIRENPLPLVIEPAVEGIDLTEWVRDNLEFIESELVESGGLLFRNFSVGSASEFERFVRAISTELLPYHERSTPRTHLGGNIYTSTEYPTHQDIALHNEFSYALKWPMKIFFHCQEPAEQGGETPLADSRQVFRLISPETRERFIRKNVMYVRNYGGGIDLPWQEAFQTADKLAVEEYCRNAPMQFEWMDGDRLRTRQVREAVAAHPKTGETVWFNQAHLFHVSNLGPEISQSMLDAFDESSLPRNAYYGDGSPIEPSALDEIREAYRRASIVFPWRRGDVLLLDNTLVAHGRKPYSGSRNVIVAMAEPFTRAAER